MTPIPLEAFIRKASQAAEASFNRNGELCPMLIADTADGARIVMPITAPTKDIADAFMRKMAADKNFVRCVFVCEAWTLNRPTENFSDAEEERLDRDGLSGEPDRVERIVFFAEDYVAGFCLAHRDIIRSGATARLGKLAFLPANGHASGRFIGILPPQTRAS